MALVGMWWDSFYGMALVGLWRLLWNSVGGFVTEQLPRMKDKQYSLQQATLTHTPLTANIKTPDGDEVLWGDKPKDYATFWCFPHRGQLVSCGEDQPHRLSTVGFR
ncbi:hypothetical protein E2C01_093114 [Portunus trituberculatus]|uniref:Uncharacterized protein n=1 Tax=Portunus trituberculatus TaxID=210409 RepID=A0A5B7JNY6_PORTR|nr:hypothetical protein [Portunus trituberculatus]